MYYFIAAVTLTGLILPVMIHVRLGKLIRMAEHPARSEHPLVKMMVHKFTACYKVKVGVNNVDSFVDKYVYTYKICGLYLSTWDRLCGQPAWILLLGCGGRLLMDRFGLCGQAVDLSTIGVGVEASGLLMIYNAFFERRGKIQALCSELKDYLDNSLRTKLEQEYLQPKTGQEAERKRGARSSFAGRQFSAEGKAADPSKLPCGEETDVIRKAAAELAAAKDTAAEARKPDHPVLCREQEIIEDILREYLS